MIMSDIRNAVLIEANELAGLLPAESNLIVLDIRFKPDQPDGLPSYLAGHIPGAVYVDLAHELSGEPRGFSGRRPLPEIRGLQNDARRWGINADTSVVVYDDNRGLQAARAWWVLRWAGVTSVRILNGGLAAWTGAGHALTSVPTLNPRGDVTLSLDNLPQLDAQQAADIARASVLVDARGEKDYQGGPIVAGRTAEGHIPGAINLPTGGNLGADGKFLSTEELRSRFFQSGIDGSRPLGVYCGGGIAGAHEIAALTSIGIQAALFPGSWSAWSADPLRPVATGATPG
jgi:thiosulfate/3-mercaptopyruvate sulfurtransferase